MAPALDPEEAAVDEKLTELALLMDDMAHNDMGWLSLEQAALFHAATQLVQTIVGVRAEQHEREQEQESWEEQEG